MNSGLLATSPSLSISGAVVPFNEDSRTTICQSLGMKAAMAAGIEALAMRAIENGDTDCLDHIAHLATRLAAELENLAAVVHQLKAEQAN